MIMELFRCFNNVEKGREGLSVGGEREANESKSRFQIVKIPNRRQKKWDW